MRWAGVQFFYQRLASPFCEGVVFYDAIRYHEGQQDGRVCLTWKWQTACEACRLIFIFVLRSVFLRGEGYDTDGMLLVAHHSTQHVK